MKAYYASIAEYVDESSRVLDIGCGDGTLLEFLKKEKRARVHGMDLNSDRVSKAVSRGLSVVQGDADLDLVHYPDQAFDTVIMALSLQAMKRPKEVLDEALRVGKQVIIVIPNFGHIRNRLYLTFKGRMPVTKTLSYEWYETPNIHFCTVKDFMALAQTLKAGIKKRRYITTSGKAKSFSGSGCLSANLFGEYGVFCLSRS